jgi:hypothetical protein
MNGLRDRTFARQFEKIAAPLVRTAYSRRQGNFETVEAPFGA